VVQSAPGKEQGPIGDAPDLLLIQQRPGQFRKVELPETAGWAGAGDAVAIGDISDDFRSDALVSNGRARWHGPQQVLLGRVPAGNAARLVLRGTRWNPLGFGARIRITVAGKDRWQSVTDGVAGASQSSNVQHIALGAASSARIRVRWPGGACDELRILAGTYRTLRIGSQGCP
jgi:hypothetical protein